MNPLTGASVEHETQVRVCGSAASRAALIDAPQRQVRGMLSEIRRERYYADAETATFELMHRDRLKTYAR